MLFRCLQGLFTPSFSFYALMLLHVFLLEILAYLVVLVFGTWWLPFSVSVMLQGTDKQNALRRECTFKIEIVLEIGVAGINIY